MSEALIAAISAFLGVIVGGGFTAGIEWQEYKR